MSFLDERLRSLHPTAIHLVETFAHASPAPTIGHLLASSETCTVVCDGDAAELVVGVPAYLRTDERTVLPGRAFFRAAFRHLFGDGSRVFFKVTIIPLSGAVSTSVHPIVYRYLRQDIHGPVAMVIEPIDTTEWGVLRHAFAMDSVPPELLQDDLVAGIDLDGSVGVW